MEIAHEVSCTHTSYRPAYSVFSSTSSTVSSTPSASASSASSSLLSTPHASSLSSPNLRWQATVPMLCERAKVVARPSESAALLPLTWDIAVTIYQELVRLIHRLPFHKRLVVCLVYRGVKFRLDLGEVKAAGIACLIGLGLSFGTLLLYRLYFRIIVPFLNTVWAAKGSNSLLDDEYTLHLEGPESDVDERMGNNTSKRPAVPSVYYAPGYGVALGARPPSLSRDADVEEEVDSASSSVRLRPRAVTRRKSPSPASDKDSAIGGTIGFGSEMSQSMYSELSNRDSFYSSCTAESGFDDLGFLDDLRAGATASRVSGSPGSLKENFSPNSLRERNIKMLYRAHHGYDAGLNSLGRSVKPGLDTLSDCSSERSGIVSSCSVRSSCDGESSGLSTVRTNRDPLLQKLASDSVRNRSPVRTSSQQSQRSQDKSSTSRSGLDSTSNKWDPLVGSSFPSSGTVQSNESSPYHTLRSSFHSKKDVPPLHSANLLSRGSSGLEPHSDYVDYDFDASESIRSFNSSADEDIDWNLEDDDDGRDMMSNVPPFHQSLTDIEFKESLMQRIQEWSSFAEEYNKSRSPTPGSSPMRFVRRSHSLDRHMGDPGSVLMSDATELAASKQLVELEPTTERNLETLEYELQDIQGEFESITSKLHELIEQGKASPNTSPANNTSSKSSSPHHKSSPQNSKGQQRYNPSSLSESQKLQQQLQSHPHHIHHPHHLFHQRGMESAKLRRLRTKWQRVPSSACSNSSRSSRASSVEYAWDLADYTNTTNTSSENTNVSSQSSPARKAQILEESPVPAQEIINISPPVKLADYAEQEWKGNTEKSRIIRQGYCKVTSLLSCQRMSVIRGDNYCGLRSVLFQVLSSGLRVTQGWSGIIGMMDSLHSLYNSGQAGLEGWTFANRLPSHCTDRLASMSKCVLSLYATIEEVCNLPTHEEREKRTISLLNTGATFDLELMEGLKVMMLLTLSDLRQGINDGEDVPIFSHLLFARDSSQTVADFLRNHLNAVGDSAGLEQVEMCLLGFALGVKVRVLRLSQCGQQDFDCVFPEDVPAEWPVVSVIAEDDRHYNVPLP